MPESLWSRLRIGYLLLRVTSPKPEVSDRAQDQLIEMGESIVKRAINGAMNSSVQPYRVAATINNPGYVSAVQRLPAAQGVQQLTRLLEDVSKSLDHNEKNLKRYAAILVAIGVEAWDEMMAVVTRNPQRNGYTMAVYQIMPQFVNRIPMEHFLKAAIEHASESIRAQATIHIQKFIPPPEQAVLDKIIAASPQRGLLQYESSFRNVLVDTLDKVKKVDKIGIEAVLACWNTGNSRLKSAAIQSLRYSSDAAHFDFYVEAIRSSEREISNGALTILATSATDLTPEQKQTAAEVLIHEITLHLIPDLVRHAELLLPKLDHAHLLGGLLDQFTAAVKSPDEPTAKAGVLGLHAIATLLPIAEYPTIADTLVEYLQTTPLPPHSEYEAAAALSRYDDPRAIEPIRRILAFYELHNYDSYCVREPLEDVLSGFTGADPA